jgi:hypothetical protein
MEARITKGKLVTIWRYLSKQRAGYFYTSPFVFQSSKFLHFWHCLLLVRHSLKSVGSRARKGSIQDQWEGIDLISYHSMAVLFWGAVEGKHWFVEEIKFTWYHPKHHHIIFLTGIELLHFKKNSSWKCGLGFYIIACLLNPFENSSWMILLNNIQTLICFKCQEEFDLPSVGLIFKTKVNRWQASVVPVATNSDKEWWKIFYLLFHLSEVSRVEKERFNTFAIKYCL